MTAPTLSPISSSQGWQGSAHLSFTQRQGKTGVQAYARAPLKLQRPLYPEGGICHSVLVHTAGGMVGGDRLAISAQMEAGSQALVTTAAANKIYRSSGPQTRQVTQLDLAPGSCLEWFPLETIVFDGAQFWQQTRINLAPGATWAGWDITRFGRSARGETFTQGHWRSYVEVWQDGRPLWLDRQFLAGGSATLTSPHGLNGQPVIASFAVVGQVPPQELLDWVRSLWRTDQPGDVGITRLQQGLLCRYRGPSSQAARQWFVAIWAHLRPWYLDRPACASRIWAI